MTKVTFTYTMEFDDEITEEAAVAALVACMEQDGDWNDSQFKIERNLPEDEDHSPDEIGLITKLKKLINRLKICL